MIKELKALNTDKPLSSLFPWGSEEYQDNLEFRNLQHFIYVVGELSQENDNTCEVTYKKALKDLQQKVSQISKEKQESIRNLVRSNLHKRGLITEEIYEQFQYTADGTQVGVDVGKYAAGEPDCVISPSRQYVDFFHELFISISYPYTVSNKNVVENTAKLLATIEELERQHIFIKITLVLPIREPAKDRAFFSSIPLFGHKEPKSVATMSAVLNDRLLRKFFFAILEDFYGDSIDPEKGYSKQLQGSMNIGNTFDEIGFFEEIKSKVGA